MSCLQSADVGPRVFIGIEMDCLNAQGVREKASLAGVQLSQQDDDADESEDDDDSHDAKAGHDDQSNDGDHHHQRHSVLELAMRTAQVHSSDLTEVFPVAAQIQTGSLLSTVCCSCVKYSSCSHVCSKQFSNNT